MSISSVAGTPSLSSVSATPLVELEGLTRRFVVKRDILGRPRSWLSAVDEVSLHIERGETFGLVGETGSGKSTLASLIVRLQKADAGSVRLDGEEVLTAGRRRLATIRQRMQLVFQDPFSSLDPRMSVGAIVSEGLHRSGLSRGAREDRILELLDLVGLSQNHRARFPHELSGGQRQRVAIARALGVGAEFLILDEPVSALDVSIQSQILNLLRDLQRDLGLTYLFISHDLAVIRHIADRVGVMYLGKLVETGPQAEIFHDPTHPYTQALISAIPTRQTSGTAGARIILEGDVPSPIDPPPHCRFVSRCFRVVDRCHVETPPLEESADRPGHATACFNIVSLASAEGRREDAKGDVLHA